MPYRYEAVSHLAIDSIERRAADDELQWLVRAAGGDLRPTLRWWRPCDGITATGELIEVNIRLSAFYDNNTVNLISERTRESQPRELDRIRGSVRHEFCHAIEDLNAWQPAIRSRAPKPVGLHEQVGICSHLAHRWSRHRPSREAVWLLTHPSDRRRWLDQIEAEVRVIKARRAQTPRRR
jgi:hypothetical protein